MKRRVRHQKGHVFERCGVFYVRYYTTLENGQRKQKADPLVEKNEKYYSVSCKPVKLKRDDFMRRINGREDGVASLRVEQFWTDTYLPFAEKHLRTSTVESYKDLWQRHIKDHAGRTRLEDYRASHATAYLTGLSERLGRNSLAHVRSLMSGIFSHAAALGHVEHNPMRDAKVLGRPKAPSNTPHYTLDELAAIMSALVGDPGAQAMVAFAGFLGLRPSEIAGLRWEDCAGDGVHIQRSVTRGVIGPTKTPESATRLPMIAPVAIPLALWHRDAGEPNEGWIFQNRAGDPIDMREFCRRRIRPALHEKKIAWKGLYAGRRTAATVLTQLTGNPIAASQLLRHRNMSVTMSAYIKADRAALVGGLKLLESAALKDK